MLLNMKYIYSRSLHGHHKITHSLLLETESWREQKSNYTGSSFQTYHWNIIQQINSWLSLLGLYIGISRFHFFPPTLLGHRLLTGRWNQKEVKARNRVNISEPLSVCPNQIENLKFSTWYLMSLTFIFESGP